MPSPKGHCTGEVPHPINLQLCLQEPFRKLRAKARAGLDFSPGWPSAPFQCSGCLLPALLVVFLQKLQPLRGIINAGIDI